MAIKFNPNTEDPEEIAKNLKRIEEELNKFNMFEIKVGIIAKPGDPKEVRNKDGQIVKTRYKEATITKVALTHEFGSPTRGIPERSFLRATFEARKKAVNKLIEVKIGKQMAKGRLDVKAIMKSVGVFLSREVKKSFRVGGLKTAKFKKWPGLKDPTRQGRNKMGGAKPLIDTGQLRNSIGYVVEKKTKEKAVKDYVIKPG